LGEAEPAPAATIEPITIDFPGEFGTEAYGINAAGEIVECIGTINARL
jgi:hypothetical protein